MRFEVPQFIEIEDKVFGPLTWRQFLYIGGGVGMGIVLFFVTNWLIFIIVGLPLILLAAALAFYPVNNRPFSYFLEAIFTYLSNTKLYLWRKKEDIIHKDMFTPDMKKDPLTTNQKPKGGGGSEKITSLARRLELEALQKNE